MRVYLPMLALIALIICATAAFNIGMMLDDLRRTIACSDARGALYRIPRQKE